MQYSRKQVLNGMKDLLPQRLIPVVLDMSYVDENKFINQVSREERHRLLQTLKHFVITIPQHVRLQRLSLPQAA